MLHILIGSKIASISPIYLIKKASPTNSHLAVLLEVLEVSQEHLTSRQVHQKTQPHTLKLNTSSYCIMIFGMELLQMPRTTVGVKITQFVRTCHFAKVLMPRHMT